MTRSEDTDDEENVNWLLVLFLAQDAREQAGRVRASMQASLAQQRASIERQIASVRTAAPASLAPVTWDMTRSVTREFTMPDCPAVPKPELSRMIDEAAERQGLNPSLIFEVARQESAFHPCAVSPKGAAGIMQLMPATQVQMQVSNPFDAKESIDAGSRLLKELLTRYHGDVSLALSAYNAGTAAVDRKLAVPGIPETQNYVSDILTRLIPVGP